MPREEPAPYTYPIEHEVDALRDTHDPANNEFVGQVGIWKIGLTFEVHGGRQGWDWWVQAQDDHGYDGGTCFTFLAPTKEENRLRAWEQVRRNIRISTWEREEQRERWSTFEGWYPGIKRAISSFCPTLTKHERSKKFWRRYYQKHGAVDPWNVIKYGNY